MERQCGKCKGQGGFRKRQSTSVTQFISGDSGWVKCNVCGGSGVNPNYREKKCERCYRTIGYHRDAKFPPKYCSNCKSVVTAEKEAKRRDRERQNAMWREKSCPGLKGEGHCGKTIRYRTDWDRVPDICPDCREKAKRAKADRESKMREKPCAGRGCNNTARYSTDWDHPPSFCKSCSGKRKAFQAQYPNARRGFETRDTSFVMPGMAKTIGQMGGIRGKCYYRKQHDDIHCMIFEGGSDDDLHYSWNVDPVTGDVIGEVYMHPNNPRGK